MSSEAAIAVRGLGKAYTIQHVAERESTLTETFLRRLVRGARRRERERFWALRDVSFDVGRGEVLGIVGRNGSGKSTLLKILSRITPPTEGRVELRGRVGSLLEVGTGFHRELTGRENIYLNGAILGMRRAEIQRRFDEIVAFAGGERFLDTPVKRYSSGMYVRLAFAVAAHLDPEILVVDEVLAVGDAAFQRKCLGRMSEVADEGRTVLLVSHNMGTVLSLCERALLLSDGRLEADGAAEEVVARYRRLSGDEPEGAEAEVRPPRDPARRAEVERIALRDGEGRPAARFELEQRVAFEIDYELRAPLADLAVTFQLRSGVGDVLFVSTDVDARNHRRGRGNRRYPREPGRYRARVQLPAPLLNAGDYQVVANLVEPRVAVHHSAPGPRFEIVDLNSFASSLFQRARRGFLALPLEWETERQSEQHEGLVESPSAREP